MTKAFAELFAGVAGALLLLLRLSGFFFADRFRRAPNAG
jgi:hypothetical protein